MRQKYVFEPVSKINISNSIKKRKMYLCKDKRGAEFRVSGDFIEMDLDIIEVLMPYEPSQSISNIREKFFKECTDNINGLPVVSVAPHDLFKWFVNNLIE